MPIYRFHLEAQDDSGHFRRGTIDAESREAAEAFLMEREAKLVAFRLPVEPPAPPPVDASEDDKREFRGIPTRDRAHAAIHHQTEPYALVALEEVM